jgi:hypothetical protein
MNDYTAVDQILLPWARKHELHVYARERDTPLRSMIIYYWRGTHHESAGHVWLEGPDDRGFVTVHGAAPDWHREKSVPLDQLENALEDTYNTMVSRPTFD